MKELSAWWKLTALSSNWSLASINTSNLSSTSTARELVDRLPLMPWYFMRPCILKCTIIAIDVHNRKPAVWYTYNDYKHELHHSKYITILYVLYIDEWIELYTSKFIQMSVSSGTHFLSCIGNVVLSLYSLFIIQY